MDFPLFARARGAIGRFRRGLRRRILKPVALDAPQAEPITALASVGGITDILVL